MLKQLQFFIQLGRKKWNKLFMTIILITEYRRPKTFFLVSLHPIQKSTPIILLQIHLGNFIISHCIFLSWIRIIV